MDEGHQGLFTRLLGGATPPDVAIAGRRGGATVLLVAGATGADPAATGSGPAATCLGRLSAAAGRGWHALKERHVADVRASLGRAALSLSRSPATTRRGATPAVSTARRIERLGQACDNGTDSTADPSVFALAFAHARYLLNAASRPGGLPANLQGVWADGLHAPWNGDYHLNINLQMTRRGGVERLGGARFD